jgi:hypothetical protein
MIKKHEDCINNLHYNKSDYKCNHPDGKHHGKVLHKKDVTNEDVCPHFNYRVIIPKKK